MYACTRSKQEKWGAVCIASVQIYIYVGVHDGNGFEIYNLWYAYVVMKCFTIHIYNEQMACILTRSGDQMAGHA